MTEKPTIPKGTRDFTPVEVVRRDYILDTIRKVFTRFGYLPIETPAMENISTLLGKYGEEGDRLIYKILNTGDFLSGISRDDMTRDSAMKLSSRLCEKGLRYDLTVPFARFVVQHRNKLVFPFKRYQIQPVWRADRPQKGRYREFYQCDVDVIGSDSLLNEIELIQITDEIFRNLGINIVIKINNRKILNGIAETIGESQRMMEITLAIDKMDKIGPDQVTRELAGKGVSKSAIDKLQPILFLEGDPDHKINELRKILSKSEIGTRGVQEIFGIFNYLNTLSIHSPVELDLTLARGLDYYTGAIIEVLSAQVDMGSIAGGGRYDDLTGIFGLPGVSGVGISFGADRIYDVLSQTNGFPDDSESSMILMFANFGKNEEKHCLMLLEKIRNKGIRGELYPDPVKLKKQLAYANARNIPFVALVGESEIKGKFITLKDMNSGEQWEVKPDELVRKISGA
jgi:histidyl-tRNA synthetase